MSAPPRRIEKLMTITRDEFVRSLAAFDTTAVLDGDGRAALGGVVICFEALPARRVGGLIVLPQGRVTLDLGAMPEPERTAFLRRFDIAFQRGGG